jgi:WD40 repeat protein
LILVYLDKIFTYFNLGCDIAYYNKRHYYEAGWEAHNGAVRSLRRRPDGTKLASCGDDGTIKIWDQQNGDCLQVLRHDRPYERLDITGVQGLTEAQLQTLRVLGAVDDVVKSR